MYHPAPERAESDVDIIGRAAANRSLPRYPNPTTAPQASVHAYVFSVNDSIKLFNCIAKRLHFNCYVVVYTINKTNKKKQKKTNQRLSNWQLIALDVLGAVVGSLAAGGIVAVDVDKVALLASLGRSDGGTGLDGHQAVRMALGAGTGQVGRLAGLSGRHDGVRVQHTLAGMIWKQEEMGHMNKNILMIIRTLVFKGCIPL